MAKDGMTKLDANRDLMNCASQYNKTEDKAWACKALADKALADDALAEGNLGRKTDSVCTQSIFKHLSLGWCIHWQMKHWQTKAMH